MNLFFSVSRAWHVAPDRRCPELCDGGMDDLEVKALCTLGKGVAGNCKSEGSLRQNAGLGDTDESLGLLWAATGTGSRWDRN